MIIQEFYSNMHSFVYSIPRFITSIRGTRIVVAPELISEVLHVPRESHPDYPDCPRLRLCPRTNFCRSFVRHLHLEVIFKTPLARALQKVRGS